MTMQSEAIHDSDTTGSAGTLLSFHPGRTGTTPHFEPNGAHERRKTTPESHTLRIFSSPESRFSLVHSASANTYTLLTGNGELGLSEVIVFSEDTNIRINDIAMFQRDEALSAALRLELIDKQPTWVGDAKLYETTSLANGYHAVAPNSGRRSRSPSARHTVPRSLTVAEPSARSAASEIVKRAPTAAATPRGPGSTFRSIVEATALRSFASLHSRS